MSSPSGFEGSIELVRRVRNYCADQEDLVNITRIALEEVASTKGFKHLSEGLHRDVTAEVDGRRRDYGHWQAEYDPDENFVYIFVRTNRGCKHAWYFSWPELLMTGYRVAHCSCTSDHRQERRSKLRR